MSSEDDLQASRERIQAERFARHSGDGARTRMSREALRLEVDEAVERNGARRDVEAAPAMEAKEARSTSAPS